MNILLNQNQTKVLVLLYLLDNKKADILNASSKFTLVGSLDEFIETATQDNHIRCHLLSFFTIPKNICKKMRPIGSQNPRLYGHRKIHKPKVHFRPILSKVGSAGALELVLKL